MLPSPSIPTIPEGRTEYSEGGVIFVNTEPVELLEAGEAVALSDFHEGAQTAHKSKGTGTRVFRRVIMTLANDQRPFVFAHDLRTPQQTIHTSDGYHAALTNFYILTQKLHDHYSQASYTDLKRLYGNGGRLVLQAVLLDDIVEANV